MDERDNTITATTAERPAPEETTETIERVPWGQQLAPVEPEASEVEEAGEESEATDGEGGELVEAHDLDQRAEQILESPEFQAVLESRAHYADPSRYSLTPKFAEIATAEDRPLVEGFFKIIAEAQAGQAFADKLLNLVAENTIALREARLEQDTADHETIERVTHGEWGDDYESNLDELKGFVSGLPGGLGKALAEARLPDGSFLRNHPEFPITFAEIARNGSSPRSNAEEQLRKINNVLKRDPHRYFREKMDEEAISLRRGIGEQVDKSGSPQRVSGRRAEIERIMKADMQRYWRDENLQREYRGILEAGAAKGR